MITFSFGLYPSRCGHSFRRVLFWLGLLSLVGVLAAESEDADLEVLRTGVVKALMQEIEKADPDEGRTIPLLEFALARVREADPARMSIAELNRLGPDGRVPTNISGETRSLLTDFAHAVRSENERLQRDAVTRYLDLATDILRRTMATHDADKATELAAETAGLSEIWGQITNTREISALRPDSLHSALDLFAVLHRFREAGDWQSFGSRLQQITRKLVDLRRILEAEDIQAYENSMLALAGLPPVSELERAYPAAIEALLDDAKQENLPTMTGMIFRHAQVFSAIASSGPYQPVAQRWQGLAQFAEDFQQQIAQAREGNAPTLRPERWTSAGNASMRLPMEREELEARWQTYEVIISDSGKRRSLLPDLDMLMADITSLAEIKDKLKDIEYAEQVRSASRGTQALMTPRLAQLAEIHAALVSPGRTVLRNELVALLNHSSMNWQYAHPGLAGGVPRVLCGSGALTELLNQARRGVAVRILGGAEIAADVELAQALRQRLAQAREAGDWEDLLAIDRLAGLFFTQGGWLSEAERQAVGHFLAAGRQSTEFNQARLAAYHLQLAISAAAELPGDALLRKHLDEIRAASPKAFDRGTGDALAGKLGDQLPPATAWILPRLTR